MIDLDAEYYPAHCDMIPVGRDAVFARNRNASKTHNLSPIEAELFAILRGCRPLRDHLLTLAQSETVHAVYIDTARLTNVLSTWVDAGLLRPRRLIEGALGIDDAAPTSRHDVLKHSVFLTCATRDRPQMFGEWLTDFCRPGEKHFGRVVVVDDSRKSDSIASNRRAAASVRATGVPIDYVSPEERIRRVALIGKHVVKKGVPPTVVEFGLMGVDVPDGVSTFGSTRNFTLLMGTGRRIVAIDDDMRRRFAHIESTDDKTVVFEASKQYQKFFPSMSDIENTLHPLEGDALEKLVEPLGHSASLYGHRVDTSSIDPEAAWLLETGEPTVIAASAGCYGARQFAIPLRTFLFRTEHSDKTIYDRDSFEGVRLHALGIRQTATLTLDIGDSFSTALCSLDATRVLLPYFMWGRREDTCFRMLQKALYPAGFFGGMPFVAFHDPSPKAPFPKSTIGTHMIDLGTYNQAILKGLSQGLLREPGPRRVQELAGRFRDIGRMSPGPFRDYLRHVQIAQLEMLQRILETELDTYNAEPIWWADELRSYISYMDREIADPDSVVALELRSPERSVAESLAVHQRFYAQWADLLEAWPVIWETARAINEEGGWGTLTL